MAELNLKLEPIRRLEIFTKSSVGSKLIGRYKSVFKGKGLEFAGYREYSPDDDSTMIDWKASSRANEIMVKEMVEERNLNVFFLIDVPGDLETLL